MEEDDYFGDLPIAKWLNNYNVKQHINSYPHVDEKKEWYNDQDDQFEMMSIATEINASPQSDKPQSSEYEDIQQLSLALQFWSTSKLTHHFKEWNQYTKDKLNILHIKYRNYKYIRDRKILFYCLKKWQLLQQNHQTTMLSITHWANKQQTNHFKQWKSM